MEVNDLIEGGVFTSRAGRDGYMFLDTFGEESVIATYTGVDPIPPEAYDGWAATLRRRREWFAARGIAHRMLVVPDTCWVYRDKLPADVILVGEPPGVQLRSRLDEQTAAQYLYPLEDLVDARVTWPTYRRTDSHWSDWGALVGLRALLEHLATEVPAVRALPEEEIVWDERLTFGILGAALAEERTETLRVARLPNTRCRVVLDVPTESRERYFVVEQDRPGLPTAVVFRDSFMTAGHKFLSESFRRVTYVTHPLTLFYDLIERERPDVVIVETAERRLRRWPREPTLFDFRSMFGDLLLDDPEAGTAQIASRRAFVDDDPEGALSASDIVVARGPNARAMMHRSRVLTRLREPAAALEALRTATTLDPQDAMAWHTLAQTALARGFTNEAARAGRRAAELEPREPQFWRFAAAAAIQDGDPGAAIRLCRDALELFPDYGDLHFTYARATGAVGALDDAESAVRRAIALDPDSALYRRELASVLIRARRWELAAQALDEVTGEDTDLAPYRAMVEEHVGRAQRTEAQ